MRKRLVSLLPLIFEMIVAPLRLMPIKWSRRLGEAVGSVAYLFLSNRKKIALENLEIVFSDSDETWRHRVLKSSTRKWGCTLFEVLVLVGGKRLDESEKSVSIEGIEHLEAALSEGKGVVAASGHVGNFPLLLYTLNKKNYPTGVIIRLPENEKLGPWLKELIENIGIKTLPASPRIECVRQSTKALRAGETVFLQVDINARHSGGVPIEFFGLWVPTFPGAAVFAQRTGAPLVPMFIIRDGPDRHKLIIRPPIYLERTKDRQKQVYETLVQLTRMLEDVIREHPEEYWWFHRRFRKAFREPLKEIPDSNDQIDD